MIRAILIHASTACGCGAPCAELAAIGLTAPRLAETARRLGRAAAALDHYATALSEGALRGGRVRRRQRRARARLAGVPEEVALRALALILKAVSGADYTPKLEAVEALRAAILAVGPGGTLKRTLSGVSSPLPAGGSRHVANGGGTGLPTLSRLPGRRSSGTGGLRSRSRGSKGRSASGRWRARSGASAPALAKGARSGRCRASTRTGRSLRCRNQCMWPTRVRRLAASASNVWSAGALELPAKMQPGQYEHHFDGFRLQALQARVILASTMQEPI